MRYSNLIWIFSLTTTLVESYSRSHSSSRLSAAENTSSHCKGDVCSFSRSFDLSSSAILFNFGAKIWSRVSKAGAWDPMMRKEGCVQNVE